MFIELKVMGNLTFFFFFFLISFHKSKYLLSPKEQKNHKKSFI